MHSIYNHLKDHQEWAQVLAIKNETVLGRQDDDRVGLLHDQGIMDFAKQKQSDDDDVQELTTFNDTNLLVNMLTTTAKKINPEFQNHVQRVMERFGTFREGPAKQVERCQSKVENDYHDAAYPAAAKLLDLVRCSVSVNTVEQLLVGYEGLLRHIKSSTSPFELARLKNCFLE